ncbi:MAG: hypothetical protein ACK44Y_17120, partial [Novosphingobium sp.]
ERLAQLSASIPASDRAAMLRDKAMRLRSPRLIATLCSAEPVLAEAAIDAARLEPAEWADLLPALPPAARARLGTRDDLVPLLAEQLGRLGRAQRCNQARRAQPHRLVAQHGGAITRWNACAKLRQPFVGGFDIRAARLAWLGAKQVEQLPVLDAAKRRALRAQAQHGGKAIVEMHRALLSSTGRSGDITP